MIHTDLAVHKNFMEHMRRRLHGDGLGEVAPPLSSSSPEDRQLALSLCLHCADLSSKTMEPETDQARRRARVRPASPPGRTQPRARFACLPQPPDGPALRTPTDPTSPHGQMLTDQIYEEFAAQAELERQAGQRVTVMLGPTAQAQAGMEVGFIQFIIKPLYALLAGVAPELGVFCERIDASLGRWTRVQKGPRVSVAHGGVAGSLVGEKGDKRETSDEQRRPRQRRVRGGSVAPGAGCACLGPPPAAPFAAGTPPPTPLSSRCAAAACSCASWPPSGRSTPRQPSRPPTAAAGFRGPATPPATGGFALTRHRPHPHAHSHAQPSPSAAD